MHMCLIKKIKYKNKRHNLKNIVKKLLIKKYSSTYSLSSKPLSINLEKLSEGTYELSGKVIRPETHLDRNFSDWLIYITSSTGKVIQRQSVAESMGLKYSKKFGGYRYVGDQLPNFSFKFYIEKSGASINLNLVKKNSLKQNIKVKDLLLIQQNGSEKTNHKNWSLADSLSIKHTFKKGILVYADLTINSIDGSSVWLVSLVKALANMESIHVYLVLKENIKRDVLAESFYGNHRITIIQPMDCGIPDKGFFSAENLVNTSLMLDELTGGLSYIILRGLDVSYRMAQEKKFHNRMVSYLTDIYDAKAFGGMLDQNLLYKKILKIGSSSKTILLQTQQLVNYTERLFDIEKEKVKILPPMLDELIFQYKNVKKFDNGVHIVYAGKFGKGWGITKLLDNFQKLREKYSDVYLHFAGDKFRADLAGLKYTKDDLVNFFDNTPGVVWHGALTRSKLFQLMASCHIGWSYRSKEFEAKNLELSTKLLEYLTLTSIVICTESELNNYLLGSNYPYICREKTSLFSILEKAYLDIKVNTLPRQNFNSIRYTQKYAIDNYLSFLVENKKNDVSYKRILVASNEIKFISEYMSYLIQQGHDVRLDQWEWGNPIDLNKSKALLDWADIIICEWCLSNAVWYSERKKSHQKLYIRLHSQEIHQRAKKFPEKINIANIDKIIFVSSSVQQEAVKMWGWDKQKLVTIPNYVLSDTYTEKKQLDCEFNIGMVGIVPKSKRFDRALDFIEKLRKVDPRWKLFIKGKRPEEYSWMHGPSRKTELDYYQDLYKRMEASEYLKEGVIFDGFDNDMAYWYQKISFVISPSDHESFHYAIADGMSAGCVPIIWGWEGASDLYGKKFIITTTDEAVLLIENIMKSNTLIDTRKLVKRTIDSNFSYKIIFGLLNEVIFNIQLQGK